ncbi:Ribonuclease H [Abeliophyllum distichum]|uniref:Ribonuclease H n=1 Tax=Abeliophyllum distichum TaxID=126358 RepID=A0ABD1RDG2_9LAMI
MHNDAISLVMTIQTKAMDIEQEKGEEGMILDEGLNLVIFGLDLLASPADELKTFPGLADFVVEFFHILEGLLKIKPNEVPTKKLYVEGSSGDAEDGIGILLINPDDHNINCALCLEFKASNNAAKYETLLEGLRLAHGMKARRFQIYSDLQLVVMPNNRDKARKHFRRAAKFVPQDRILYKQGFSLPLLQYVTKDEADYIMQKIHEGFCDNHARGMVLA